MARPFLLVGLFFIQCGQGLAFDDLLPPPDLLGKGGVSAYLNMTREQRFAAQIAEFGDAVGEIREKTTMKPGKNLAGKSLDEMYSMLGSKASKGVMLTVENLSNRLLGEPHFYARCGYLDPELGLEQSIPMGVTDIFLLHNRKKSLTSSCGTVSWQIMDGLGRAHKLPTGQGLRLFLTWSSLDSVRGNKCEDGKANEFYLGFQPVDIDSSGHSAENFRTKYPYKRYHKLESISRLTNVDSGTRTALVYSTDGEFQVRAVMSPNCLSNLTVEVLGMFKAEMPIVAPDEDIYTGDEIWEQMIRQSWLDIVRTINRDSALYGIGLAPLYLDPLMPEPIHINQEMVGYQVDLSMWNVTVVGIQDIALDRLTLQRGQGLNNLREQAVIAMGDLEVKGMYQYTAECTAWICVVSSFDSEGPQPFSIRMTNATFSVNVHMDTVNGCGVNNSLVVSYIDLPIGYSEITFDFTNIGTVLGAAVSLIGGFALDFSKGLIVDVVKQGINSEVPTLLCDADPLNITLYEKQPPRSVSSTGPWHDVLEAGHAGWGMNTLRRDILAEKLIMKAWNDGISKHFANESDPIVKALDPFQLLPASEDIHEKGVFKAHIVACELFLRGLRNLSLTNFELVRNSDLTYSALRLTVGLPAASLQGHFRLNHVYILSLLKAKDSIGTVNADLTGIEVVLTVVMNTTKAFNQTSNSNIRIPHFEVEFHHQNAVLDVQGLGGKIVQKIANKVIKKVGDKMLHLQREAISTEIKNIFWGLAKCLMYNPGKGFQTCMDEFWECLGFEIPFKFPGCPAMYATADEEIAKFPSYRAYLKDYKQKAEAKANMVAQRSCLAKPGET